ncbi:MAG: hypothetical protein RSF40_01480 [Oscillospiraceae bacterium]
MFKVIWGENKDLINIIREEYIGAYSDETTSFLVTDEEYEKIEAKYHFNSENYNDEDEKTGYIIVDSLNDYLEMQWEDQYIPIDLTFVSPERIEINLLNDVEIALQAYESVGGTQQEENVKELLQSKDWYNFIYKETAILMLSLVLDTTKAEIEGQIRALEN